MTNKQTREYKAANQRRRERLLTLYHGVKPSSKAWIPNPGFIQKGKEGSGMMLPFLSGENKGQLHTA